ncbi:MAG: ATP-binding protein [Anaerolineae bacterium]
MEIHLRSELGNERIAMVAVALIAEEMGGNSAQIENVKTALAEAVTNAIEHGNQFKVELPVLIKVGARQGALTLNVIDNGCQPIPPASVERQERPDHRGLGMFLIRSLMDEVETVALPGRNELRMVAYVGG